MKNNFWLMLVAIVASLSLVVSACGDDEEQLECEEGGGTYVGYDDETGELCEDEDPECTYECEYPVDNNNTNNNTCSVDADCGGTLLCIDGACQADNTPQYRFVMINDLQSPVSGDYPGSDIDSVELVKAGGTIIGAQNVESWENLNEAGNLAVDPTAVLGAPNSDCNADSGQFYAMGGLGSWMVLSYGDAIIENGDSIDVFELGPTDCGTFDDDTFAVGISLAADDMGTWIQVGNDCTGGCSVTVSGL